MSPGSLVGFGVLAVLLLTAFSAIATAGLALSRARLRRSGPAAERSAAAWALMAPVGLALATVVAIAVRGSGGVDHCVGHEHHAHFCLAHGGAWLERPWAMAVAAASGITFALRLALVVIRRSRARMAIAQVRRVADRGDDIRVAPSERVFCFVAGWRHPEVFVSSRAWQALSATERAAVVAHEHAHAANGDLWLGAMIDVAAVFAAPLAGNWLHARWADASERLCDLHAARVTDPASVASALVRLCRAGRLQQIPAGFTAAAGALDDRVRAVLARGPTGSGFGWIAWSLVVGGAVSVALLATQLHHAFETLLG